MKRRSFLKTVAAGSAGALGQNALGAEQQLVAEPQEVQVAGMARRLLGRTGRHISIVGYPGFALRTGEQEACTDSLHQAFEQGINYFDVAPAYDRGNCEIKMGVGLQGIKRDEIFLACKTKARDKDGARKELEVSLERLKTEYFDLYQLHCLIKPEEVEQAFGPGGAMETVFKAKEQGIIRHIGFSAHTTKAALAALNRFDFDTVMFPINFVEMFTFDFGRQVLDLAAKKGAGVLAIKPMSAGNWASKQQRDEHREQGGRNWWYQTLEEQDDINLAMRWALSQKGVVAGLPPAYLDLAERGLQAGMNYRPASEEDNEKLRKLAAKSHSVFLERQQVARHKYRGMHHFDGPHEGCPGMMC
jgi:predicted aldo/keto reductase-like oxidoreductase